MTKPEQPEAKARPTVKSRPPAKARPTAKSRPAVEAEHPGSYDLLSQPMRLPCGQVLPNRLMKSALSEALADAGRGPDVRLERLYRRWGAGGWGLLVTGNVMIDSDQLGEPGNVVVEDDRHLDALSRWAKSTQDGGARVWMQINHPGRQANPLATRHRPVAPSAVAVAVPGTPTPRALLGDEIDRLVDRYVTTALVAETAGFDGVQIHGAHGYLVSQFLSPLANRRDDEWGGDPERRMRFLLEIVRRIRRVVSPSFGLGLKLNSADFQRGGFSEDDSRLVVAAVAAEAIDMLEISGGSYESPAMMGRPQQAASTRAREAYFLDYAATVRADVPDLPLAVTGGFRTPAAMEQALADDACDLIGLGRPGATVPEAGSAVRTVGAAALPDAAPPLRLPARLQRSKSMKSLAGALDLMWHEDQLHRLGDGLDPDLDRPNWRTALSAARRNGIRINPGSRRGSASADARKHGSRKFAVERAVGRTIANPAVRFLGRLGAELPTLAELETRGRRTGQPRVVPVSAAVDETGAWIISQHGSRSGWAVNITAEPRVRLRQGGRWRTGTAEFWPDDDVVARLDSFSSDPAVRRLLRMGFRALQTSPVTVRVTFDEVAGVATGGPHDSDEMRC